MTDAFSTFNTSSPSLLKTNGGCYPVVICLRDLVTQFRILPCHLTVLHNSSGSSQDIRWLSEAVIRRQARITQTRIYLSHLTALPVHWCQFTWHSPKQFTCLAEQVTRFALCGRTQCVPIKHHEGSFRPCLRCSQQSCLWRLMAYNYRDPRRSRVTETYFT